MNSEDLQIKIGSKRSNFLVAEGLGALLNDPEFKQVKNFGKTSLEMLEKAHQKSIEMGIIDENLPGPNFLDETFDALGYDEETNKRLRNKLIYTPNIGALIKFTKENIKDMGLDEKEIETLRTKLQEHGLDFKN